MLVNAPSSAVPSAGICESWMMASANPPLPASTAAMTATMPTSITMPWMKSFITVAM